MTNTNISKLAARLDSDLLRTFLEVASSGSFSQAGCQIFRSQSAVSLQMKQLEAVLGQALFKRHGRGVHLTQVGERLQPLALQVVGLLDKTAAEFGTSNLRGALRIGIPDEYGDGLLAALMAQFARDNPEVELAVRCSFSAGFPQALANDELDLAVHALASPDPGTHLLRRQRTCWVASRHHLVHQQRPLPLALFDRSCWWRDSAMQALTESGIEFREVFSSESVTGISAAVAAGVAVALIGEESLRDEFLLLTTEQGFPEMPESSLVLQVREGADNSLVQAMCGVIEDAFS
jgi:DNA-binding transcriptional LysR family regulator